MSRSSILKLILIFLVVLLCSLAGYTQNKTPVGIEDAYLAKDDGKGQAGEVVKGFTTTDIPIYCIVQLDSTTPVTVKMNLVAENVPGVKAETKVVTTSYTTKDGQNRVNFYGRPVGKWTAGKYRADIFIDGVLSRNIAFEITAPANLVGGARSYQPAKPTRSATPPRKHPYAPFVARTF